jgi:hypothetical protein
MIATLTISQKWRNKKTLKGIILPCPLHLEEDEEDGEHFHNAPKFKMKKEVKIFYIEKKEGLSSMAMFLSHFTWNALVLGHEM